MKKLAKEFFVLISDDVRQEVGNKISIMGIYSKEITVPDIPFVFPKFYIVIIAKELKVEIGELKIIVSMPENEPIALNLPAPPRQIISQDLQLAVGISPLKINKEGK